ncbi:hypothetical protein [Pannonibacter tanglangensis]|uniref:Uncharacterized protein n=1 Tax=Pannonibacter tanglangensis TaxID=2750084 RepID=A0ABW9ZLC2_9HYPH|nr:hypothetical protein [Pannonibacter sp. XCT-34]NBN65184.1 hypothetical protein [Pannonibacter sp. XCT-34]
MRWLTRHAAAINAAAALVTAVTALGALLAVKVQLDEADRLQRLQSARDAYRAHLTLAISSPEYARPDDACALLSGPKAAAYEAFVDHLLYSAEQMLESEPHWEATFNGLLSEHPELVCSMQEAGDDGSAMQQLITRFRQSQCSAVVACRSPVD